MTRAGASRSARAAGWIAVGFFLWRGGAGMVSLPRELAVFARRAPPALTAGEDQRIRTAMARWERRAGLEPGSQWALFATLRREVPPDGEIHFVTRRAPKGALALSHVKVLLYPRRVWAERRVPPNWRDVLKPSSNLFVLEFDVPYEESLAEGFDLVAEGADFRLWRFRGGGR